MLAFFHTIVARIRGFFRPGDLESDFDQEMATHLEMARLRRGAIEAATELAETRALLLEDLDRKNKELEAFSYSVSHDLRAPLRSIDGFSQILVEDHGEQLGSEGREQLLRVRAAVRRMYELIEDLLKLSRLEQGSLCRETVDLSRLGQRVGDHHPEVRRAVIHLSIRRRQIARELRADGIQAIRRNLITREAARSAGG